MGVVLIYILDTFRRALYSARPIDKTSLVVELLVLLLIFGEIALHAKRHFRHRRRSRKVLRCLKTGQQIQASAPSAAFGDQVDSWQATAQAWAHETNALLAIYSDAASSSFLHEEGGANASFGYGHVHPGAQPSYVQLQGQSNNLRRILENADVYL